MDTPTLNAGPDTPPLWRRFAEWCVVFSPAWVLAFLVATHAVNIPVWDGWERALLLEKWRAGSLTWTDLYAPHIDHRIVVPRLIILAVAEWAQGDVRWEIGCTWLFGFATGLGIWKLAQATLGGPGWPAGIAFLANLWIFSPLQYDNWLWPIQTAFVLPTPCLVWALYVTIRPWHWGRRAALAALLATVGTHGFAHGLLIWPAVLGLVLLTPDSRDRWKFVAVWAVIGGLVIGCYFGIDYRVASDYSYNRKVGDLTPLAGTWQAALADFGRFWQFFLSTLGGPGARQFPLDPVALSPGFGYLALLAYSAAGIWGLRRWRRGDADAWRRALPWLALGGATLAIALGISAGRSSILAPARATVPRFLTVTLHLSLALLALSRLWWMVKAPPAEKSVAWGVILGLLIALQAHPWIHGIRLMNIWKISRLQAQAHVRFIEHFTPEPWRILSYQAVDVRDLAPRLNRLGLLDPPLVKDLRLSQFSRFSKPLPLSKGAIDAFEELPDGSWRLAGHGILRDPSRPADAVLLSVEKDGDTEPEIVGLARYEGSQLPTRYRIDLQFSVLDELNETDPGTWMRWEARVDPKKWVDARPVTLRVWIFDQTKTRLYPLGQTIRWEPGAEPAWVR